MSKADSMMDDLVQLYEMHIKKEDGTETVRYAYGLPWIAQALYMDDIYFDTPEAAKAWWEKEFGT